MRLKLLYLALHDPHVPLTGTGARGHAFVENLSRRMDVELVYMAGSGQPPIVSLENRAASRLAGVKRKTRVPYSSAGYFLYSPALHQAARETLRRRRHDYVLCDYGLSGLYGVVLAREFGTPFVYCSHNLEYKGNLDKSLKDPRRLPLALYMRAVEQAAVRRARVLVPITEEDARFYERWTASEKMIVIPQCVDADVFNPFYDAPRNSPRVVLFCGNFKIQFNRDAAEACLARVLGPVLARRPDVKFVFVGAHPPEVRHPNVEFTGFVEDYPARLKAADVVISPMLQGRGFPTKIVEALACGKPVVSTAVGARAIGPSFANLEVRRLADFPDAIVRALDADRPVTRDDFAEIQAHFSWAAHIDRLADRMESLAGASPARAPSEAAV